MDSTEGYFGTDLTCGETDDRPANPVISPVSYVHRFSSVGLTTEIRLRTRDLDPSTWAVHPYAGTQNTYDATAVVRLAMIPTVAADLAADLGSFELAANVAPVYADVPRAAEDFALAASVPVGEAEAPEVSDLRSALPEMKRVPFANDHIASLADSIATERSNVPSVGTTHRGPSARLLLQQLTEMARQQLGDVSGAIARVREELDRLTRTMTQPAPATWAAAVTVRGGPVEEERPGVAAEVLDPQHNTVQTLTFPLAGEAGIRKGRLAVALGTPEELIGQTAAVFLKTSHERLLLGIVPIEHGTEGFGKLRLEVDLASLGIEPSDGVLSPTAFDVVVKRHSVIEDQRDVEA